MIWIFRTRCRVLLTEVGGHSTGDQALCVASIRRLLKARCNVTVLQRTDRAPALRAAGLDRVRLVDFILPKKAFSACGSSGSVLSTLTGRFPELYERLLGLLKETDVVLTAPGGRMMDGYAVPRNLAVSFVAMKHGIPVVNLHQSVGPVGSADWRDLLREWMEGSTLSIIRDERSLAFARGLGMSEHRLHEARDLIFAERAPAASTPEYDLGINLRFGSGTWCMADAVVSFLERMRRTDPHARVLAYTTTDPLPADMVAKMALYVDRVEPSTLGVAEAWAAIGRCAFHITDSFHGAVFAMMMGRPLIPLQSDYKSWKLIGTTAPGMDAFRLLGGLRDESDAARLLNAWLDARKRAQALRRRGEMLALHGREAAEAGWRRVLDILS